MSRNAPLISVVVPLYNTELYVADTIRSLLSQTFADFEVIVVNDGSPDSSVSVVKEVAGSDPRVVILDKPNGGLSSARNYGVLHASGSFLYFLDSDDWVSPNLFEYLVPQMLRSQADFAMFRGRVVNSLDSTSVSFYDWRVWLSFGPLKARETVVTSWKNRPNLIELEPQVGLHFYKTSFFKELQVSFAEGLHYEDLPVHLAALASSENILLLNYEGFCYRVGRPNKITDERSSKRLDILEISRLCVKYASFQNNRRNLTVEQGGALLLAIFRMAGWCEGYLPRELVDVYVSKLFEIMSDVPSSWLNNALERRDEFVGRQVRMTLVASSDSSGYRLFVRGKRFSPSVFFALVARGHLMAVSGVVLKRRLKSLMSTFRRA